MARRLPTHFRRSHNDTVKFMHTLLRDCEIEPRLRRRVRSVNLWLHLYISPGETSTFFKKDSSEQFAGKFRLYLELLRQYTKLNELSLVGYCLLSNHVHLVVAPGKKDSLAVTLKQTHGRYASYWNSAHSYEYEDGGWRRTMRPKEPALACDEKRGALKTGSCAKVRPATDRKDG